MSAHEFIVSVHILTAFLICALCVHITKFVTNSHNTTMAFMKMLVWQCLFLKTFYNDRRIYTTIH